MVSEIHHATGAVTVLTTLYNMSAFSLYPPFDKASAAAIEIYNLVIRQVAQANDALVADIWEAEGAAPWTVSTDTVHANRLGHMLIGQRVFQTVVTNCSGAAHALWQDPIEAREQLAKNHRAALERTALRLKDSSGHQGGR